MDRNLWDVGFVRKFSTCLYKNKKLPLGEMDLSKDFVNTDRADKYPVMFSEGDHCETVKGGKYIFASENGKIARLMGHLSPFAVYEAVIEKLDGEIGFLFKNGENEALISLAREKDGTVFVKCGDEKISVECDFEKEISFSVQPRRDRFDVFLKTGIKPEYITTFTVQQFGNTLKESVFMKTAACIFCAGNAVIVHASFYMDSGISQADLRTVRYENGDIFIENGKVFITASVRLIEGGFQGVFSWVPGTEEFELTGALFFDAGDGQWCSDVASSVIYNRKAKKWMLWVCSFSHGHILGHAEFDGDPRYGKNVIDITLVRPLLPEEDDTVFGGKQGDEDPDIFYDEEKEKWYLAVCRVATGDRYRYFFFESASPFGGFSFVGSGIKGSETGGSFVKYGGKLYFVCGNSFEEHSDYRVYEWGDFLHPKKLSADHPDGGFRGWGTVFGVPQGTRKKYYWITFDRHNASEWNWSYGNIHCFEGFDPKSEYESSSDISDSELRYDGEN